ncbi:LysR family transcriptional regulator [Serratia quinivorans]|jgi:DNA-binding transcriptional LysR family regulator|uniref:LysR family transcriptional regulator n=1 Tax=Serratia quinivorans TaxID=137545 RepID=UPI0021771EE7|nr:LysR family transcriptional regulator [Serratia quinivorans]CAI0777748.1 D-malate degradation protein R [Serratia quinivorans]CAI1576687.1 D-malate degradation protein R [Serratia quinivorans]
MISSERLHAIRAFVQAVQAGSFSRAAEQLGLSRSTVGKAVARLEQRLQVRLFQRTTRSLSLTDEGQLFYDDCLKALAALEAAESQLAARARKPEGRLRVSLPVLFGQKWVMPPLLALADRYPQLQIEALFSNRAADLAEEGIDLAVRIGSPGDAAAITARQLGEQQQILCAAPAYLKRQGQPGRLAELVQHQAIGMLRDGRSQLWHLLDEQGKPQRLLPPTRLRLGNMEAVLSAACAGQGIAMLPRWLAHDALTTGTLREILPGSCGAGLAIHVVWLKGTTMPLRIRVAIDALLAAFTPKAPWQ